MYFIGLKLRTHFAENQVWYLFYKRWRHSVCFTLFTIQKTKVSAYFTLSSLYRFILKVCTVILYFIQNWNISWNTCTVEIFGIPFTVEKMSTLHCENGPKYYKTKENLCNMALKVKDLLVLVFHFFYILHCMIYGFFSPLYSMITRVQNVNDFDSNRLRICIVRQKWRFL